MKLTSKIVQTNNNNHIKVLSLQLKAKAVSNRKLAQFGSGLIQIDSEMDQGCVTDAVSRVTPAKGA